MLAFETPIVDGPINEAGQVVATTATYAIAVVAFVLVMRLCRRERIIWPAVALVGGTLTCLLEPLFDHLYGLWFPTQGHWDLFSVYGVEEPVWLPAAYLTVYGALPVFVVRRLNQAPTTETVWRLYAMLVVVAMAAEITYVDVLEVYNYQYKQPFEFLGYPLFLGFMNSMSALISGIVLWRLTQVVKGRQQLLLWAIAPMAFAIDAVGSGFIYLTHSGDPNGFLLHVAALLAVLGVAGTVRLAALLLPASQGTPLPVTAAPSAETPDPAELARVTA